MAEPNEPTQLLIQSNKVDVMAVKTRDGDKLGSVHAFMINKRSGHAVYAILSIGGFLGMGKAYYPLPFSLLAFEPPLIVSPLRSTGECSRGAPAGRPIPRSSTRPMPTGSRAIMRWPTRIYRSSRQCGHHKRSEAGARPFAVSHSATIWI